MSPLLHARLANFDNINLPQSEVTNLVKDVGIGEVDKAMLTIV